MKEDLASSFLRLVGILDELREKCPWDRKQTIQSLRSMTIEETYELTDAVSREDWPGIKEELGDLLLHVLFYARIASEQGKFSLGDTLESLMEKLIFRHPHIYGPQPGTGLLREVRDEEDVKKNWEKLKQRERQSTVLGGVPRSLPALVKAERLQEKAAQVGFEWEQTPEVREKVQEELVELDTAVREDNPTAVEEEFGDLLFSLINYARFLRIDAEHALQKANAKFTRRFTGMEQLALTRGKALSDMTLSEMDALWNSVKQQKLPD